MINYLLCFFLLSFPCNWQDVKFKELANYFFSILPSVCIRVHSYTRWRHVCWNMLDFLFPVLFYIGEYIFQVLFRSSDARSNKPCTCTANILSSKHFSWIHPLVKKKKKSFRTSLVFFFFLLTCNFTTKHQNTVKTDLNQNPSTFNMVKWSRQSVQI